MSVGRRTYHCRVRHRARSAPGRGRAQAPDDPVRAIIADWVAQERPPAVLTSFTNPTGSVWTLTRRFYTQRDFTAAWRSDGTGADLGSLVGRLGRAAEQGLDSADYPVAQIRALATSPSDPDSLALLDLAATVAFFRYAADLSLGRVVPAVIDSMWAAADRPLDLAARLAEALDSSRVDAALGALAPPQREAALLRAALARYRAIAAMGGWTPVPGKEPLSLGATGPRVGLLRRRLEITGDVAPGDGGGAEIFDSALDLGVRLAQARHGLTADGVAGPTTLAALNVSVTARIRQLELNLERWRWAPRDEGERYLLVNSADYSLEVVDSERGVLTSRIVAGRADWPTPIVAGLLTEVTFNPRWSIPRSIAVKEILPILRRDPGYLLREGIHVTDATDQTIELDPALIAWDSVTAGSFPYRLWQEPGPQESAGAHPVRDPEPVRGGAARHAVSADVQRRDPGIQSRLCARGSCRVAGGVRAARTSRLGRRFGLRGHGTGERALRSGPGPDPGPDRLLDRLDGERR